MFTLDHLNPATSQNEFSLFIMSSGEAMCLALSHAVSTTTLVYDLMNFIHLAHIMMVYQDRVHHYCTRLSTNINMQ